MALRRAARPGTVKAKISGHFESIFVCAVGEKMAYTDGMWCDKPKPPNRVLN